MSVFDEDAEDLIRFAALEDDGAPGGWFVAGIGHTPAEARADAENQREDLDVHSAKYLPVASITPEQAKRICEGEVTCAELGIEAPEGLT